MSITSCQAAYLAAFLAASAALAASVVLAALVALGAVPTVPDRLG